MSSLDGATHCVSRYAGGSAAWPMAAMRRRPMATAPDVAINLAMISGEATTSGQLEDFAGDDHALDLGGALADLGELGVAEDALDREFGDVAGAAVDLHGLGRGL